MSKFKNIDRDALNDVKGGIEPITTAFALGGACGFLVGGVYGACVNGMLHKALRR
jgi:hypothetical protein